MSNIITPTTLPGFMELLPKNQVVFEKMKRKLEDTYRLFGFFPIDTPVLERSDILLAKAGGETEKQIYRFDKGDTDITMRFDLTVPLAKYVAKNYNELSFPFKRFQIGKVYRGEKTQRGRFREFYQADIDIVGNGELSILNDAEIPSIIYTAFNSLGLDDFTIRMNNRKILSGIFEMFSLKEKTTDIMRIIDKIDKIGPENVCVELEEIGIASDAVKTMIDLLSMKADSDVILEKLKTLTGKSELFDLGVSELEQVIYYIGKFGVPQQNYRIDLTIARGLDYYTGTVYETTFNQHPEIGSVCSGGRYDNLAEYYTKNKLPGVGMSIGLTRLFYILCEKEYLNTKMSFPAEVLIIPMTDDMTKAVEISSILRNQSITTQIYMEKKKFKHKIAYADELKIPFVIFLGEDEINNNQVTIKDMVKREQSTLRLEEAIEMIKKTMDSLQDDRCIILE